MMKGQSIEACCICECPTGRAGKADDSFYCDFCDEGPFCEDCYDEHINECSIENGQLGVGE